MTLTAEDRMDVLDIARIVRRQQFDEPSTREIVFDMEQSGASFLVRNLDLSFATAAVRRHAATRCPPVDGLPLGHRSCCPPFAGSARHSVRRTCKVP
jgi:hypothetical protein